ncbi:tubulin delta chain-like [Euwallacea similis]|uniref:tubulin delta chain-like n=1 Tax=Euwallacea similis TaxID=1736056 RepID=UPI00344E5899
MSILTLQLGQCGNQIGQALYSVLDEDIKLKGSSNSQSTSYLQYLHRWFNVDEKLRVEPRSILVDTEQKVTTTINSSFTFNSIVAKTIGGSANNWACGYMENSKLLISDVLEYLRQDVEKSDFLTSFLCLYGVAGGTGSGVGSSIIEQLRFEYPKKTIINCAVLPYVKGEISVQAYNCLLSLAKLYYVADSTILFENERLTHSCKYSLGLAEVSTANINNLIAQQLVSSFKSTKDLDPVTLISNLTAMPLLKFLQLKSEPNGQNQNWKFETSPQWSTLVNQLLRPSQFEIVSQNAKQPKPKIISSALMCHSVEPVPKADLKRLRECRDRDSVLWLPKDECFKVYHRNEQFLNYKKFLTYIFNGSNIVKSLDCVVGDAWTAFSHGAFLHHYKNYGINEEDFLEAFQQMENVLNNYKNV